MSDFAILAPVSGPVIPLEKVPDPAFAEKMLGDGLAIDPQNDTVVAPFNGTVTHIHKSLHAITLRYQEIEVLIHIGVDTVSLNGDGFQAHVQTGDSVQRGQPLVSFKPDWLAKNAPCNWVITVLTAPEDTPLQKTNVSQVKAGQDILFSLPELATAQTILSNTFIQTDRWTYSRPIVIRHENGLHARPAAVLAQAAKDYSFTIEIEYQSRRADVKSLVAVMGLGLSRGAEIRLRVNSNTQPAKQALEKLTQLLEQGNEESAYSQLPQLPPELPAQDENCFTALTACTGIAQGVIWKWQRTEISFAQTAANPSEEKTRLEQAIQQVWHDLQNQLEKASPTTQSILQAHQALLKDSFLTEQAAQSITQGKSAPAAFNEAIRASIDVLKNSQNRLLTERMADLKDIRRRVLEYLTGIANTIPDFPENCLITAEELLPSDISLLDERVKGVVLAYGSPTAHASILLRNKDIPALVAAGENILQIPNQTPAVLNATQGFLQLHPSLQQTQYATELQQQTILQRLRAGQTAHQAALTTDGIQIYISGNASNLAEAQQAQENGADGLGLVRTEFLFYKRTQAPTEEEQYELYQKIANTLPGKPITLRTLDVGGDKPVSYIPLPAEENPIMGLRGVRNYAKYRDIFIAQIRAMLRVTPVGQAHLMLPMISFAQEISEYKKIIEEEKEKLGIHAPTALGIMVEVPSAALLAEQLAPEVDFFSIGTNDLTQYTLAIDRGHKTLCAQADPLHPAVLRLIANTCQGAAKHHKPVAVCGAVASDLEAVPILIGLGVTELAVSPNLIAPVKDVVRHISQATAAQIAKQALQCTTAAEVRQLSKKEFNYSK